MFFVGCLDQEELLLSEETEEEQLSKVSNQVVLGKQLENPYTVENMRKAYKNIKGSLKNSTTIDIETTHLYVRCLPANEEEISVLQDEREIQYFDIPLDFEIEQPGGSYHDPSIADGLPTYQYTVVEPDYDFPDVEYEVLAELFLNEEDTGKTSAGGMDEATWNLLEDEALRITDNWEESTNVETKGSKWRPSGIIKIEERIDSDLGDVPLEGCKVLARRWFSWDSRYTDSRGSFIIFKDFRGSVNYSLQFETSLPKFTVTNAIGASASHTGPKIEGSWNLNLPYGNASESWTRATILNAITDYRTQARRYGVKLPGSYVTFKIRPKFKNGRSGALGFIRHYIPPTVFLSNTISDIWLYTKFRDGSDRETDDLYRLVMHELAHLSHFLNAPLLWGTTDRMSIESWAVAIEYYFTNEYYPNIVEDLPDQPESDIDDGDDDGWNYTPYFIDLRDETNQRTINGGSLDFANDNVANYTIAQLQDALSSNNRMDKIFDHLEDEYSNGSEHNLDDLLDFYQDIKDNN